MFSLIDEDYILSKTEPEKVPTGIVEKNLFYYQFLLNDEIESEFSETDLYLSRYYWLNRYYSSYKKTIGNNAGVEQQIGKLIEVMCNKFDPQFDWNIIENVSKMAEYD